MLLVPPIHRSPPPKSQSNGLAPHTIKMFYWMAVVWMLFGFYTIYIYRMAKDAPELRDSVMVFDKYQQRRYLLVGEDAFNFQLYMHNRTQVPDIYDIYGFKLPLEE